MDISETQGREIGADWSHALSVWWLLIWRGLVGVILALFAVGIVVGIVQVIIGISHDSVGTPGGIAGLFLGLAVGVFVVRMALRKKYNSFRIALIAS